MEGERRKYPRIDLNLNIYYRIRNPRSIVILLGDEEVEAASLNLSEGGIALVTECNIPVGTLISMKLALANDTRYRRFSPYGPMEMSGQVRSNTLLPQAKNRLGVYFMEMETRDRHTLRNFVSGALASEPIT